ncbi:glycosyl hydrolase [Humibacillus xanthopallidus]|uniref:Alpha-L-rhamnosidase-like protein n=1 Tax=Humibacillus xanthopallidus TaxID=412689 RepID=A0A543HZF1_9MICO|nr:glycosyl hydrolase [Humibacillus xanthopallidus]TQM63688.1 alpha-L-rhamnosidase-like protein [Humibacillus xanthopallidus]
MVTGPTPQDPPVRSSVSRRRFITMGAVLTAGAALPWSPAPAAAAAGTPDAAEAAGFARSFRQPPTSYGARFRWWWPCGNVDPDEVAKEVDAAADAGFAGLEIADVHHSIPKGRLDPQAHGWGTAPWVTAVTAALRQAQRRGITIDLTIGPSWPAAVPTVTPDDVAASSELAHGLVPVAAGSTYDGVVPAPVVPAKPGATRAQLIGVHAAKVIAPPPRAGQPSTLDQASVVDLTASVHDGRLTWTAPATGSWVILSYWQRGSGQEPEAGPHTTPTAYVVDHFSAAGTAAVTDFWEQRILTSELRRLLASAGNTLFEDSLEIETDATLWTPGFLDIFRSRMGYDLYPWLPVIIEQKEKYLYVFAGDTTNKVRDDVAQCLSDLYAEHHLLPLRSWAHDLGLELRVQGYGLETDSIYEAALFDQPESESLGFKNLDDYRALSGGRDMGGRSILSCEAAAYAGGAYNTTWNKALQTLGSIYAGGVNQAVLHGFSYADAPGAAWPGFAAFSPYYNNAVGYGEAWGPRQPMWRHVTDVADHLRRTQFALRAGVNRADLAWYRQKGWTATGIGVGWGTSAAIGLGWSYGFITAPLLRLDTAQVRDGRLAPDGPAYKAIIIEGDRFRGNVSSLQLEGATELLRLARAGLPIVFVGDWSSALATGLPQGDEDAQIRDLVAQLRSLPVVRTVTVADDIPKALAELGVERAVEHDPSTLMHVQRFVADTGAQSPSRRNGIDVFYLANARHAENRKIVRVEQDVWLTASSAGMVPYRLDTFTGEVTPIAVYEVDGRHIRIRVALNPAEGVVVALAPPKLLGGPTLATPAVGTDAASISYVDGRLVARATTGGTCTTVLADGRAVRTTVPAVPAPLALTRWDLSLEDWQPGSSATDTTVATRTTVMDGLTPWTNVSGLEDVSGVGHYSAAVELDDSWDGVGAYLDLGAVFDTFRVRVNGRDVPTRSVLSTRVDVGTALRPGHNLVEVEAPSTLFNRLRTVNPTVFGSSSRQAYGLLGPVTITPYRDVLV